ncbi:snapalysin [Lentzea albidocapillata subsp. violacea]|uniref:Extracellular small neutral protease n=1 Tax=Lentzea albidocapillata subsp. violacea TaxID=128104 RepID=A0A1G9EEQ9_9PSEU|nr:snapalysin family zinc-dependent metalloprotease [Lentzea albidocapillata]SDK74629.1 snapalysin [Lentzea albidocapillata subsp. violacea]
MSLRKTIAVVASAAALSVGLIGTAEAAPRVITYNSSGAAEFVAAVDAGANVWNTQLPNTLNLRKVTGPAHVTIVADNGWPRAQTTSLGRGRIWMGRLAVNEGHDTIRIAAHELGHILGLPDRRTGLCTDLMSGASAGTSCKNPNPNAAEKAQVVRNFGRTVTVKAETFQDAA